ncbi:DUF3326 domain-containing protein [Synechococcus elongatus IITB4]|uniref:DUF3326 domain-containing protein n=1 Tax=Synechococcus elongatus TaxID=32046 RepID=UPI0030CAFA93
MLGRSLTTVLIVPTGIGCAVGGYAGDALPLARAIASVSDRLITHPNVMNGASLYWPLSNVAYVEGYALDRFAAGDWQLQPVHRNRIGLLLDAAIEPELRIRHQQVAEAAQATLGLAVTAAVITDAPLGVTLRQADSGSTWGTIDRPDSLLRAAEQLLKAGCEAIAVIARFPDDPGAIALQEYRQGQGVDPLAGAEAVISHLIVREFQVPCAHAPALQPLPLDTSISPRSAAEELGHTFLPCVLAGLSRAPRYCSASETITDALRPESVDVVVAPESAIGGPGILHWAARGIPILAVAENQSTLDLRPADLGVPVQRVQTHLEAVGWLAAYRAGLDPGALSPGDRRLSYLNHAVQQAMSG